MHTEMPTVSLLGPGLRPRQPLCMGTRSISHIPTHREIQHGQSIYLQEFVFPSHLYHGNGD